MVQGCVKRTRQDQCQDALAEAAPELHRLCHLGPSDGYAAPTAFQEDLLDFSLASASLPQLADPGLECSLGCANLFSPFCPGPPAVFKHP